MDAHHDPTCAGCHTYPQLLFGVHDPNHQLGTAGSDSGVPLQVPPLCLLQGLLAAQPTGRPVALLREGFHHGTGFLPVLLHRLARWSALSSGHWALLVCLVQVRRAFILIRFLSLLHYITCISSVPSHVTSLYFYFYAGMTFPY